MSKFNAPTPRPNPVPPKAPAAASKAPVKTEVRNSPIPKQQAMKPVTTPGTSSGKAITHEAIAQRAYFIWKTSGGSEFENWIRAERELRAGK